MKRGVPVPGLLPLMKRYGLTQQDVARSAPLHLHTVTGLVMGTLYAQPTVLAKLRNVFGLPDTRLLTEEPLDAS